MGRGSTAVGEGPEEPQAGPTGRLHRGAPARIYGASGLPAHLARQAAEAPKRDPRASIPSKFETVLRDGKHAVKDGFNSRTERFSGPENDLPGPGRYKLGKALEFTSDSLSKKGFGSGFVSRARRFDGSLALMAPGPGAYHQRTEMELKQDKYFNKGQTTAVFSRPLQNTGPPRSPKVEKGIQPGPGEYGSGKPKARRTYASSFRSGTDRFREGRGAAPSRLAGPGSYRIPSAFSNIKEQKYTAFKSSTGFNGQDPSKSPSQKNKPAHLAFLDTNEWGEAPGPGTYDLAQESITVRIAARPGLESSIFGRTSTDRFGRPLSPRVARDSIPGPGAYMVERRRAMELHGATSAFLSGSLRGETNMSTKPPGPSFYRPQQPGKKSFNSNTNKKWM